MYIGYDILLKRVTISIDAFIIYYEIMSDTPN